MSGNKAKAEETDDRVPADFLAAKGELFFDRFSALIHLWITVCQIVYS